MFPSTASLQKPKMWLHGRIRGSVFSWQGCFICAHTHMRTMHLNAYMHTVVCANVGTWKQLKNNKKSHSWARQKLGECLLNTWASPWWYQGTDTHGALLGMWSGSCVLWKKGATFYSRLDKCPTRDQFPFSLRLSNAQPPISLKLRSV